MSELADDTMRTVCGAGVWGEGDGRAVCSIVVVLRLFAVCMIDL